MVSFRLDYCFHLVYSTLVFRIVSAWRFLFGSWKLYCLLLEEEAAVGYHSSINQEGFVLMSKDSQDGSLKTAPGTYPRTARPASGTPEDTGMWRNHVSWGTLGPLCNCGSLRHTHQYLGKTCNTEKIKVVCEDVEALFICHFIFPKLNFALFFKSIIKWFYNVGDI